MKTLLKITNPSFITMSVIISFITIFMMLFTSCEKNDTLEPLINKITINYKVSSPIQNEINLEDTLDDLSTEINLNFIDGIYLYDYYVINNVWTINSTTKLIILRCRGFIKLYVNDIYVNDISVDFEQNDTYDVIGDEINSIFYIKIIE
jgi:hypothetical protein